MEKITKITEKRIQEIWKNLQHLSEEDYKLVIELVELNIAMEEISNQ